VNQSLELYFDVSQTGWWYTHPSEKYESELGLFPIYGKIKNVPNHQPDMVSPSQF
jgi:hypothetical protein